MSQNKLDFAQVRQVEERLASPQKPPLPMDWNEVYQKCKVETLPWYNPHLDRDLKEGLQSKYPQKDLKRTFLDLGTGPGTQALAVAELYPHFTVFGTDISEEAIHEANLAKAKLEQKTEKRYNAKFIQDNILAVQLKSDQKFDIIFDRGCFHVFEEKDRAAYLKNLAKILAPNGTLFLKCFSTLQPEGLGPHRFGPQMIRDLFGHSFHIESSVETEFEGAMSPNPKALFSIITPKI